MFAMLGRKVDIYDHDLHPRAEQRGWPSEANWILHADKEAARVLELGQQFPPNSG